LPFTFLFRCLPPFRRPANVVASFCSSFLTGPQFSPGPSVANLGWSGLKDLLMAPPEDLPTLGPRTYGWTGYKKICFPEPRGSVLPPGEVTSHKSVPCLKFYDKIRSRSGQRQGVAFPSFAQEYESYSLTKFQFLLAR